MTHGPVWDNEKGVFIRVVVRPRSKEREFVAEVTSEFVHVNLSSPAREGKANTELIKRMAKTLGVSTGDITLVSGHKSREKTLFIQEGLIESVNECLGL